MSQTITGPGGCSYYDFQTITVPANAVLDYSFTWTVPDLDGTYVVEVSLIPMQLTAYDAKWLEAGDLAVESADSIAQILALTRNVATGVFVFVALFTSQILSGVSSRALLLRYKGKNLLKLSRLKRRLRHHCLSSQLQVVFMVKGELDESKTWGEKFILNHKHS